MLLERWLARLSQDLQTLSPRWAHLARSAGLTSPEPVPVPAWRGAPGDVRARSGRRARRDRRDRPQTPPSWNTRQRLA